MPISTRTVALIGCALTGPAAAQFAKSKVAIKYRQAVFTVVARHFGVVAGTVAGKIQFDTKVAAENAEIATMMSRLPYGAFGPGIDLGETRAKSAIWTDADKFKAAASKMQENMARPDQATRSGKLDTFKAAVGATGKSCKACNDDFRKED